MFQDFFLIPELLGPRSLRSEQVTGLLGSIRVFGITLVKLPGFRRVRILACCIERKQSCCCRVLSETLKHRNPEAVEKNVSRLRSFSITLVKELVQEESEFLHVLTRGRERVHSLFQDSLRSLET